MRGSRSSISRSRLLTAFGVAAAAAVALSCARAPTGPEGSAWHVLPGHVESVAFPAFRNSRVCWVYLPPGYAQSGRRYPVLYLNDGENAFDGPAAMHVDRLCEGMIRRGEIEPIIVVAIDSGGQRFLDYTPWPAPYWQPNGGGDAYLLALRDTLKPLIDARFRTASDATHTAIAGESLGGLISAYAGYEYDSTFGIVGALSPTYDYAQGQFYTIAQARGRPTHLVRFYQGTGYWDDNYIGYMERLALEQGFIEGVNFMSVTIPGGEHGPPSWAVHFPGMLRFLFPLPSHD